MTNKLFPTQSSDITIFGKQSNSQKLELMSRAHVLLVPGVREGWGLVVTEANAMGTPAVAYDVPGLRDSVIDGVNGTLVQSGDHVGMAVEAAELLKDHLKRKRLSKNGMQIAARFDWNKTASHIQEVLLQYALHQSRASLQESAKTH
jgi:glycosyltransferase involved in cell wall biosynthesis